MACALQRTRARELYGCTYAKAGRGERFHPVAHARASDGAKSAKSKTAPRGTWCLHAGPLVDETCSKMFLQSKF